MTFGVDDKVLIELNDICYGGVARRTEGIVCFASKNGRSLMLAFDAVLDGHVTMMPVLLDDDGLYRTVMTGGNVVTLTRIES